MTIRTVVSAAALENQPGVEVVVNSAVPFPVRDELAVLRMGNQNFTLSRYPETGDTHTLVFTLTGEEFAQTTDGAQVTVQYGLADESPVRWLFGQLNKSQMKQ